MSEETQEMLFDTDTEFRTENNPIIVAPAVIAIASISTNDFSDVSIRMELEIGQSFQPPFWVDGRFKRNGEGAVVGIGSAFRVKELFQKLDIKTSISSKTGIPNSAIQELVGRAVWRLRYLTGFDENNRPQYKSYQRIENGDDPNGKERLLKLFREENERGFPRDFDPEAKPTAEGEDKETKTNSVF